MNVCVVFIKGTFCFFMKLRLISWNVRGLNNPQKRESVKHWLRSWKCDAVCLQETKLEVVDLQLVRSLWGSPYVDWDFLPAIGSAGGVLMIWDTRVLEKINSMVKTFSVSCHWKGVADGLEWVGSGLYGPTNDLLRRELWEELKSVYSRWNIPWVVFGDFNVIRFPSERLGCTRITPHMLDFSDFIETSQLIDLPLGGGPYTWSNGSVNPAMSRIDRFLISSDLGRCIS
jgi:hypothetical protein